MEDFMTWVEDINIKLCKNVNVKYQTSIQFYALWNTELSQQKNLFPYFIIFIEKVIPL